MSLNLKALAARLDCSRRQCFHTSKNVYSLKAVVTLECAVVTTFGEAAMFEICAMSRTDIDRFVQVFPVTLCPHEQLSIRV